MAALSACLAVWGTSEPAAAAHATTHRSSSCCRVAAGTTVEVELADQVSTKVQKTGDTFPLRLAAPLVVDGRLILRAGATGGGEVVEASKPGMGGKPAKLVLAARYLTDGKTRVPLQGLQSCGRRPQQLNGSVRRRLDGHRVRPARLRRPGRAWRGRGVSCRHARHRRTRHHRQSAVAGPRSAIGDSGDRSRHGADGGRSITVPPPPPGKGQVVFFRKRTLLGTAQWFNVRESGKALGKLSNGAYFIDVTAPGTHIYTATEEPELKDHLTLEVAAGQTYFVEGVLSKGVVLSAADLTPSSPAAFALASGHLKPAPAPTEAEGTAHPAESKPPPG